MYDGGIRRELVGEDITEHALIASALNVEDAGANQPQAAEA
jgi:ribose transport system ATP-binding protein